MSTMSFRLPDELAEALENLAKATGRTKSFLALDALKDYLARESWQIADLQRAVEEADAGDFATDTEVASVMRKWKTNGH